MKYNGSNLKEVLDDHGKFETTGRHEGSRAIFSEISAHDFEVPEATLIDAEFSVFDCTGGVFRDAILRLTTFMGCEFKDVDFSYADMRVCRFLDVEFVECDFEGTDFSHSHFYNCTFAGCDLLSTKFERTFFDTCSFNNVLNVPSIPMACPDKGAFIGWKKAWTCDKREDVIVELLIPEDAKRSSALGRKCRCDKAVVLDIQDLEGASLPCTIAKSVYDHCFIYAVGKTVVPEKPFNDNRFDECSPGIHFFINREEAVQFRIW